ncbi:MAG: Glyceraldehyde-3-phosphate dehydrogenase 1 [Chlamydiia bacterium]|nr:Glyceraldehyde-3-phosphate dehydrogenase 1 [Chlamydiia bacterium]MCH9618503.1 Glyceraldehyde-3-phosphate dehydrogenase 1 [Chlamydiia bacterium]MCH9623792.1 Glyceraldehyde-3-phosphate dehydrogenase 1 [Chlamydiia bacterium]
MEIKMVKKVAINGFGRIGRLVFRALMSDPDYSVALINDLASPESLAYLLKYDSIHGVIHQDIRADDDFLYVDGDRIQVFSKDDPKDIPYTEIPVDFVVESTGFYTTLEGASRHLAAGAKRVIVTAPSDCKMFVMGVNHHEFNPHEDAVVSCASCTTNCLAPIAKVLNDNFGIEEGLMTTVHAVTAAQKVQDGPSRKDFRGGRGIINNIIPSSTGAAKAVGKVVPELAGKLTGMAFRVPVDDVSVVDLTVRLKQSTSLKDIGIAMKRASDADLKGILGVTDDPVVSTDFKGCILSSIYDEGASIELNGNFFKLVSWYDNEWGYANRVCDMMRYIASVI